MKNLLDKKTLNVKISKYFPLNYSYVDVLDEKYNS